jgi:hypothetical protein
MRIGASAASTPQEQDQEDDRRCEIARRAVGTDQKNVDKKRQQAAAHNGRQDTKRGEQDHVRVGGEAGFSSHRLHSGPDSGPRGVGEIGRLATRWVSGPVVDADDVHKTVMFYTT